MDALSDIAIAALREGAPGRAGRFVGRQAEIARLEEGLETAIAGRGGLCLISGEPGIGKTRLAGELARRAAARGVRVLWGRCWEDGGAPPYWPWTQVLRACVKDTAAGARADGLGPLLPELGGAPLKADDGAPAESRFRLFDSTALFLRQAAAERPLVLLFDDMHAADESSLLLLRFCATELETARVLIVCTHREAEVRMQRSVAARFGELARAGQRIALSGWDRAEVREFLGPLAEAMADEEVAAIRQITQGNPFFVDEVAGELAAGRLPAAALQERSPLPVPDGVRETVRRRLAVLPESLVRLLALAAVIGREFHASLLGAVLAARGDGESLPPVELIARLGQAVAAGILVEPPDGIGRYSFAHALIRETLRNDVPASQRMVAHRVVGEVMEGLGTEAGQCTAELAHHFLMAAPAGGAEKAVRYSRLAGTEALARSAYEDAAAHYQRALDALQFEAAAERPRCEVLLALGFAFNMAGRVPDARDVFRRAGALARRIEAPDLAARAAIGFGRAGESGAMDEELVSLLEAALAAIDEGDSDVRARLLARLAMALYFSTDRSARARYERLSSEALEMARRIGDRTALGAALVARHFVLCGPQGRAERLALSAELANVAAGRSHRDLPLRELALEAKVWRAVDLLEGGDGAGFRAEAEKVRQGAELLRLPFYQWHSEVLTAMWALACGDMEDAARAALHARELGERCHVGRAVQFCEAQLFHVLRHEGRLAEIEPALRANAEKLAALPIWRCALAVAQAECGRLAEARALFDDAVASDPRTWPCDGNWLPCLALLAEVCAALGDREAAALLRDLLAPHAGTFVVVFDGVILLGPVDHFLGLLSATLGETAAAARSFETAAAASERLGAAALGERSRQSLARMGEISTTPRVGTPGAPTTGNRARRLFRCDGDYWTIAFGGVESRLKHSRGLFYLASLLQRPGEELHAVELASLAPGAVVRAPAPCSGLGRRHRGALDTADAVIDQPAKLAYRQRLRDLEAELAEAEDNNDLGRAEALRAEMQAIADALSSALGLGGRSRNAPSDAERARIAVTKAILLAVRAIGRHNPVLQRFLSHTIRTGRFCGYHPDPEQDGAWD